jgi:2-desacetyl-2-hydroxyethyl bacteriochlorophyllide A dehydrogenase
MRAAFIDRFPAPGLAIRSVPGLVLEEPNQLLVRVEACGICGTDLHILTGESYRPSLPFVLGHEPVGTVVAAGSPAVEHWVGRRVTVTLFWGCGECDLCVRGDERLCVRLESAIGALARWGGFAEHLIIRAEQAVEVPGGLSSPEAASLADAGATARNSVRALENQPRYPVVVGGGPVGFLVAELLRADKCVPIVVQRSQARARELEQLGYEVVSSIGGVTTRPDAVIDCTGSPDVLPWALEALLPRGAFIPAGYAVVPEIDMAIVSRKELVIRGVRSGSRNDLVTVLDMASSRRIRLPRIDVWPLTQINEAIEALRRREVPGKVVIDPWA